VSQQTLKEKGSGSTLFESLENLIHEEIKSGQLKPGDRLDSTTVLAKKYNVSHTTVANSLQRLAAKGVVTRKPRSGTYVNTEKTNEEGPNTIKDSIAIVAADNRFPEFLPILAGLQDVAHENKLNIIVGNTNGTPERFEDVIRHQIESNPYGLLLGRPPLDSTLSLETALMLKKSGIPVVQLYGTDQGMTWPSIGASLMEGVDIAIKHLSELGREKIACVGYSVNPSDIYDSFCLFNYIFIQNLTKAGLVYDYEHQLPISAPRNFESAMNNGVDWVEKIVKWIGKHEDIDAIVCFYDRIAWAVLRALKQMGKRVPQDVAVTGLGNLESYYEFSPSLTTIDESSYQMGVEACKLFIAMNNGDKFEPNLHITVDSKLVIGKSTVADADAVNDKRINLVEV
jgi:GntR family transcriptional regulator of arabinose operon